MFLTAHFFHAWLTLPGYSMKLQAFKRTGVGWGRKASALGSLLVHEDFLLHREAADGGGIREIEGSWTVAGSAQRG